MPRICDIDHIIISDYVAKKILVKHGVSTDEVEEALRDRHAKIRRSHDDRYEVYGRTEAGRYLLMVIAYANRTAVVITARDMDDSEKRFYEGR